MVDKTLKVHEELIDKHDTRLDDIQQDLIDLKVRLGIKDKTNGQVIQYQKDLEDAQELERNERKEQDAVLMSRIDKVDERLWYIATGVCISILLEIGFYLMKGG